MDVCISFAWKTTVQAEAYTARKKTHKCLKYSIKTHKNTKQQLWLRQQTWIQALSFLLSILDDTKHVIWTCCTWSPISKTKTTGPKMLQVYVERLFWNRLPFPLVSMENQHLPLLLVLILVRQASSVRNTRKFRQLSFFCVQKAERVGYVGKGNSKSDRTGQGKRHLAAAVPCPGTCLWWVESLSHTSPLICISTLSGTQLFLTLNELLAAHSSYHFPTPLVSSSGGESSLSMLQWCQCDFPFFGSSQVTIMGQCLPRKWCTRVQLHIHMNFTPFHKQIHSSLL